MSPRARPEIYILKKIGKKPGAEMQGILYLCLEMKKQAMELVNHAKDIISTDLGVNCGPRNKNVF